MNKVLEVAILGTGNIAGGFDQNSNNCEAVFSHAKAYKLLDGFHIKSVVDIDLQKAKDFANYWNVEHYFTHEDAIISKYHDVVSVCTPDQYHFNTVKKLIINRSCKTIFVEKPIAMNLNEIDEIELLSQEYNVDVIVNFQRHFDPVYQLMRNKKVLSVNSYYIKGLNHIGVTMIDTLILIFGFPNEVMTFNKVNNQLINDNTYEFILYYQDFNIVIQTIDQENKYNYHIFDINIYTDEGLYSITDNSNTLISMKKTEYSYSEVSVLSTDYYNKNNTNYNKSMLECAKYIYSITRNEQQHTINKVSNSYNIHLLVDYIIQSFNKNEKICLRNVAWKK